MTLELYQIDAFTTTVFKGNPACVVPLKSWLPDAILLQIAAENAVAETAFFVQNASSIHLRWFTPEIEMDLCGHATLAAAHCLRTILHYEAPIIQFETASGKLTVQWKNDLYCMDLPARMPKPAELPLEIKESVDLRPVEVYKDRDFLLVYPSEKEIRNITIDRTWLDKINLDPGGVVVTAPGDNCDFVSRYFTPQASILEDPVTGSAHCSLIPFWAKRLNKLSLRARQLSKRGGELYCRHNQERVEVSGSAVTYFKGVIHI